MQWLSAMECTSNQDNAGAQVEGWLVFPVLRTGGQDARAPRDSWLLKLR